MASMHDPSLFALDPGERKDRTLKAVDWQGEKRIAAYGSSVYHARMADAPSSVSRKLKQLRQRAGLSIREVAHALGMENGSSYQHYEDRFRKPFLPLRSEEHTSELQSPVHLVCRLLLEKKN